VSEEDLKLRDCSVNNLKAAPHPDGLSPSFLEGINAAEDEGYSHFPPYISFKVVAG
jgi:hypothetical protein